MGLCSFFNLEKFIIAFYDIKIPIGEKMQEKHYKRILSDLESSADVENSFIVSRDGLLIYPEKSGDFNAEAFAAMGATLLGAAEAAVDEMSGGLPTMVVVRTRKFNIIATGAGPKAMLAVVTSSHDIDAVYRAMEKAAKEIDSII
ncbi:MAG: hypothetical protein DRN33_02355 [Thermoplasmata archaeon]|jgi:predicted regulator of Ras-like GTPase activity (Roadblock/LC7/MglB family)|nr:MAG: hypothetical protein DRN33_02355 [Thermoplasmata archaeon]